MLFRSWDDCEIYDIVDALDETAKPALKIWLDTGTHEPGWERAAVLRDRLIEKGWRLHDDLHFLEAEGAGHSEGAWAGRIDPVLRFLFPPPPPAPPKPPRFSNARKALSSLVARTRRLATAR